MVQGDFERSLPMVQGDFDDEMLLNELLMTVSEGPIEVHAPSGPIEVPVSSGCWSRQLCGRDHPCTPGFKAGLGHFKNKFCERCRRDGILVLAERVCLTTSELQLRQFENSNGRSVWTQGARLVNQTMKCAGPALLIFEGRVPAVIAASAAPLPDSWLCLDASFRGAACIRFTISKGTLVPVSTLPTALCAQLLPRQLSALEFESAPKRRRANEALSVRRPSSSASPSSDDYLADQDGRGDGSSAASASPPRLVEAAEPSGDARVHSLGMHAPEQGSEQRSTLELSRMAAPTGAQSGAQTGIRAPPSNRRTLLAAHVALEREISAALHMGVLSPFHAPEHVVDREDGFFGADVAFPLGSGYDAPPPHMASEPTEHPFSMQEREFLSAFLPQLRLSSTILRASMPLSDDPPNAYEFATSTRDSTPWASGEPPFVSAPDDRTRPATAGTLPPSPPSLSRPLTSDSLLFATNGKSAAPELSGSCTTLKAATCTVGTQTGLTVSWSFVYTLVDFAIWCAWFPTLVVVGVFQLYMSPIERSWSTLIFEFVLPFMIFFASIAIFVLVLRLVGILDVRSARVLTATWWGRIFRCCCLPRSERYRVMDEEKASVIELDKSVNKRLLARTSRSSFCICFLLLANLYMVGNTFFVRMFILNNRSDDNFEAQSATTLNFTLTSSSIIQNSSLQNVSLLNSSLLNSSLLNSSLLNSTVF